eukprot:ANDGO_01240.mRNA.1 hypothetical protein SAMD00019534_086870
MLNSMQRSVNDIFVLCQDNRDVSEIEDVVRMMERSAEEFRALQAQLARSPVLISKSSSMHTIPDLRVSGVDVNADTSTSMPTTALLSGPGVAAAVVEDPEMESPSDRLPSSTSGVSSTPRSARKQLQFDSVNLERRGSQDRHQSAASPESDRLDQEPTTPEESVTDGFAGTPASPAKGSDGQNSCDGADTSSEDEKKSPRLRTPNGSYGAGAVSPRKATFLAAVSGGTVSRLSADELALQLEVRHAQAAQKRADLLAAKSQKSAVYASRIGQAHLRKQSIIAEKEAKAKVKLEKAERSHDRHLESVMNRANRENSKAEEVVFIQGEKRALERFERESKLEKRMEKSSEKRKEYISEIKRKGEEFDSKKEAVEERRREMEAEKRKKIEAKHEKQQSSAVRTPQDQGSAKRDDRSHRPLVDYSLLVRRETFDRISGVSLDDLHEYRKSVGVFLGLGSSLKDSKDSKTVKDLMEKLKGCLQQFGILKKSADPKRAQNADVEECFRFLDSFLFFDVPPVVAGRPTSAVEKKVVQAKGKQGNQQGESQKNSSVHAARPVTAPNAQDSVLFPQAVVDAVCSTLTNFEAIFEKSPQLRALFVDVGGLVFLSCILQHVHNVCLREKLHLSFADRSACLKVLSHVSNCVRSVVEGDTTRANAVYALKAGIVFSWALTLGNLLFVLRESSTSPLSPVSARGGGPSASPSPTPLSPSHQSAGEDSQFASLHPLFDAWLLAIDSESTVSEQFRELSFRVLEETCMLRAMEECVARATVVQRSFVLSIVEFFNRKLRDDEGDGAFWLNVFISRTRFVGLVSYLMETSSLGRSCVELNEAIINVLVEVSLKYPLHVQSALVVPTDTRSEFLHASALMLDLLPLTSQSLGADSEAASIPHLILKILGLLCIVACHHRADASTTKADLQIEAEAKESLQYMFYHRSLLERIIDCVCNDQFSEVETSFIWLCLVAVSCHCPHNLVPVCLILLRRGIDLSSETALTVLGSQNDMLGQLERGVSVPGSVFEVLRSFTVLFRSTADANEIYRVCAAFVAPGDRDYGDNAAPQQPDHFCSS